MSQQLYSLSEVAVGCGCSLRRVRYILDHKLIESKLIQTVTGGGPPARHLNRAGAVHVGVANALLDANVGMQGIRQALWAMRGFIAERRPLARCTCSDTVQVTVNLTKLHAAFVR